MAGNLRGTYIYNGKSQLAKRVITNMGADNGTTEFVHDLNGNVITEADGTEQSLREYIWLPYAGYAGTDLPLATVDGVASTPVLYHVHTDHVSRPVMMTDSSKAQVWQATWGPFGQAHSITGTASTNLRFPGQWYQLEAGVHYNWHRHYDPSLGRYTQPDPLGFVDGPSVYAYARSNPNAFVDPTGQFAPAVPIIIGIVIGIGLEYLLNDCATWQDYAISGILGAGGGGGMFWRTAIRRPGTEFSHFIPDRYFRRLTKSKKNNNPDYKDWLPEWLNNKPLNGNYVSPSRHHRHDPYRYVKGGGEKFTSQTRRVLDRTPGWVTGAAAGGGAHPASGAFSD